MAKQTFTTGQVLTSAEMTALQANDYNQTVSAKVASYTLVAADAGTRITMSNAGATTITVNTSLFTAGDTLFITNIGAGASTITAGTATVSTASSLVLAQYDSGRLYFTSTGVAIWEKYQGAAGSSSPTARGCSLYLTASQSIPNATDTIINWTNEAYDTDAYHDNVTNNSRITVPTGLAGKYLLNVYLGWSATATGYRQIVIKKNGSLIYYNNGSTPTAGASGTTQLVVALNLSVADYITIQVYQNSGGLINVNGTNSESYADFSYLGA